MPANEKIHRYRANTTGVCPECLSVHSTQLPHDKDSLYYNCMFYGMYNRWPTWADAAAHCQPRPSSNGRTEEFRLFRLVLK